MNETNGGGYGVVRLCIERIVRLKLFIMMEKGYTTRGSWMTHLPAAVPLLPTSSSRWKALFVPDICIANERKK